MKKLIGLGLLLVACHRTVYQPPGPGVPGAATPREAVVAFLAGIKAEDLQAMSAVWGTPTGLARDNMSQKELEDREIVTMRCLRHDKATVISDGPGPAGSRVVSVTLNRGNVSRTTDFTAVMGPQGRWFYNQVVMAKCPLVPDK